MPLAQTTPPREKPTRIEDDKPHNVCAYCRVSTDETDQRNSLEAQKQFFEYYFEDNPNWTNVGIFADEGLSGTSLNKRTAFQQMYDLAMMGKIDIIITKEVSRFSRNVQDLLNTVEELRKNKVYVWFLSDNIYTENKGYREPLNVAGNSAENESRKTSNRVKWGQMQKMKQGVVFGRREMYGYNIVREPNGKQHFVIIEEEAKIIKQIFEWYAAGDGTFTIARKLKDMGVKTKRYKNGWSNTVILRLLRNEKYVGDLLQGKTYTDDELEHKKKYNRGDYYTHFIKDHHPESAIIDRELWDKVQAILKEKEPSEEVKQKHNNKYWTSGKVFCGLCGGRYVSLQKKQKNGKYKAWTCFNNHQSGLPKQKIDANGEVFEVGCNGKRVNDRVLKTALYDIITQVIKPQKEEIKKTILEEMQKAHKPKDNRKQISSLEHKLNALSEEQQELTRNFIKKLVFESDYIPIRDENHKQMELLRKQIEELKNQDNSTAIATKIYDECIHQLDQIVSLADSEINEGLFERITKKIVVYPLNILELHLSFMVSPIYLQYTTSGRGDFYKVEFDVLNTEQFAELLKNAPKNDFKPIPTTDITKPTNTP